MTIALNDAQELFVATYGEVFEFEVEVVINRALSSLSAHAASVRKANGETSVSELDGIINFWCAKFAVNRNQSSISRQSCDRWILFDDFGLDAPGADVFPSHWESLRQFLRAFGFTIDQNDYDSISITYTQF